MSANITVGKTKTLMVMAGGTGGHVYPAMAVADHLKQQGWNIVWLCTKGGMENRLIENKDYQKVMITMQGVRGKGLKGWIMLPFKLLNAFSQAYFAIKQYPPNVVLGMGGFAAFPGGIVAWLMRKPLLIHEQNSVAGLTNKTLAYLAKKTLVAFPSSFGDKAILVGNPVRKEIIQIATPEARFKASNDKEPNALLKLLVVGGSLGAHALNEIIPKALSEIALERRPVVVHQAGEKHITALKANYQAVNVSVDAKAFINDMASMYAWADVVFCRAGALTIAELSAAGVASVLVPFPYAVDNHQTGNARYLSDAGAAILVKQTEFTVQKVVDILKNLDREKCLNMAIKARKLGKPEATVAVATICMALAI